ncbi:MAG: hypothetical protein H6Q43_128 [Deltaproteobacteria bacterium]|nr:hypothetical protein [Deltaproteobacteria bacterium]
MRPRVLRGSYLRREGGERLFQWNRKTSVSGFPAIGGNTIPELLREGLAVKVIYTDAGNTRMAGRIEVKRGDIETLKGWEHPFGCGTSICWPDCATERLISKTSMGRGLMMHFPRRLGRIDAGSCRGGNKRLKGPETLQVPVKEILKAHSFNFVGLGHGLPFAGID